MALREITAWRSLALSAPSRFMRHARRPNAKLKNTARCASTWRALGIRKAKPTVEDLIKILAERPRTKALLLQSVQKRLGISQSPAYSLFKAAKAQYGEQIQENDKKQLIYQPTTEPQAGAANEK